MSLSLPLPSNDDVSERFLMENADSVCCSTANQARRMSENYLNNRW